MWAARVLRDAVNNSSCYQYRYYLTIIAECARDAYDITHFEVEASKAQGGRGLSMGLDLSRGPRKGGLVQSAGRSCTPFRASGRKLEKFTVSVNVAAGSKVTFELTYEELLKRHKGKYEMYLKVQPKQLVKHFEVIKRPANPTERARANVQGCGRVG